MTNNEVFRNVREVFAMSDSKVVELFSLVEHPVEPSRVAQWSLKPGHSDFVECEDSELSTFLNGLICGLRGQKEGAPPVADKKMTNNLVLKKLKIALDLKNEDVIELLASVGVSLNKYELTGFLRKPSHKNYRFLKDQDLKAFFEALKHEKLSLEDTSE